MKNNLGSVDRILRLILGLGLGGLYFFGSLVDNWNMVALVFSLVFLVTALAGSCPVYTFFGIKTRSKA